MNRTRSLHERTAVLLLGLAAACTAQGAVVTWNFGVDTGSLTASSGAPPSGLGVTALSRGNSGGLDTSTTSASSGYAGASGAFNGSASAKSGGLDTATSTYWEFSLTAEPGSTFTLTDIGFGSRSTSTGPVTLSVRYGNDSYGTDLASAAALADGNWAYFTPSLSDTTGVSGETITYRIYGYGGTTTAANWRIDDLAITVEVSAVPVPEPSTYAGFAGALLLGFGAWRRTRRA